MCERRFSRVVRKFERREAQARRKRIPLVDIRERCSEQPRTSDKCAADNTFNTELFCLLFNALPVRWGCDRKLMEIHQPLKTFPAMVRGVYGEIKKFPFHREAVSGHSKIPRRLRFCPEVSDCVSILRGMLYKAPMELDDCRTADVVAPETVVTPVAKLEFTKERVHEDVGIACGTNDFYGVIEPRWWNEQVNVSRDPGGWISVEGLGQGNAFDRNSRDSSVAELVQEAGEFLRQEFTAHGVAKIRTL